MVSAALKRGLWGLCSLAFLAAAGAVTKQAAADVLEATVEASGSLGTFGGREYIWAQATLTGTASREGGSIGAYRVPISLMYPKGEGNGVGFVDVVNTADFLLYSDEQAPFGKRKVAYIGDITFSDYLRVEGFTYIAIQWSRMVTEVLGPGYGEIEDGRDGYEIVKDAARFLRQPDKFIGNVPSKPQPVNHTIGFGQSQSASLLLEMARTGQNREADRTLVFDGIFLSAHFGCLPLNNSESPHSLFPVPYPVYQEFVRCGDPLPDDGKFISMLTESDLHAGGSYLTRDAGPNFRQYELAGVAHIPTDMVALKYVRASRQNPTSLRPPAKALLRNLVSWVVEGIEPPASIVIQGEVASDGGFHYATDADGNVTGGVRLPHMSRRFPDGSEAGAPLGVYRGLDTSHSPPDLYPYLGGTFTRFSDEELQRRYPSRKDYVRRVRLAADALVSERFLLEEDRDAYVDAAQHGW